MKAFPEICSLDYLVGTLSTAYKGVITSLAMKNFCMTDEGKVATVAGTVLSMPPGVYEASLIEKGIELARTRLEQGSFKLEIDGKRVKQARELQIDIVQSGRHIGTFLLKKEGGAGGIYISAVELSAELKGIDFRLLTDPLRNKVGLLRNAEEIITSILSTKKDWADFSRKLRGFAEDFFWSEKAGFYKAFPILAQFSLNAAEKTDSSVTTKPLSDFLDCIAIPLHDDADDAAVRAAVDVWLNELKMSEADLSADARKAAAVFTGIHQRFPEADLVPALTHLLASIRKKLSRVPLLPPAALAPFRDRTSREESDLLVIYDHTARAGFLREISAVEQALGQGRTDQALLFLSGFDPALLEEARMTARFYESISKRIASATAGSFIAALTEALAVLPVLPSRGFENVKTHVAAIINKLISFGRADLCSSLLGAVERTGSPLKEEIIVNQTVARAVLRSESNQLISGYTASLVSIPIPSPGVRGISSETWAEVVNPVHLDRLAGFMDILELGDDRLDEVLVHVIANLYITGVFIPDDRLYQRKISAYLNSGAMTRNFLLNYLLLQKLPVYFNEVGAAGNIRDYSTEIDAWGNDPVLYFVRKQVHVNASNNNVMLIEKVIRSWVFNDPGILRTGIPPDVYAGLKPELFEGYSRFIRPFFENIGVLDAHGLHLEKLIRMSEDEFRTAEPGGGDSEIRSKVFLLCRLYREIVKKYSFAGKGMLPGAADEKADSVLRRLLDELRNLKQTVLAPAKSSPRESLYFKRHIAFGIPSVLGTYHERKFDALAELLRGDAAFRVFFEDQASAGDGRRGNDTKREAESRLHTLSLAYELLALHGLENIQIEEIIQLIRQNSLHLSQACDLLKLWQKELSWMVNFFNRTFQKPVGDLLMDFPEKDLPERLMHLDRTDRDFPGQAADIIVRDMIAGVPAFTETDRIIERILKAFESRIDGRGDFRINEETPEEESPLLDLYDLSDAEAIRLAPRIGNKAKNIVFLHNRGFPVPAAVVLSSKLGPLSQNEANAREFEVVLRKAVGAVENRTGMTFGGAGNPLFLSVRSGSYISMPGILDTVLYCGMNRETVHGFIKATGDARLAWDSYRRFIEHYAASVLGLDIRILETIRNDFLHHHGFAEAEPLKAADGERLVGIYQREIAGQGLTIPEDVHEQLLRSARAIYASWSGSRVELYRRATKVSGHWGTAVTLMRMVYGNAAGSGAAVFFTRNPFSQDLEIYGETREMATGDDLAYGRQVNRPLSKKQATSERDRSLKSLEETDPDLFVLLSDLAIGIENAMGGLPQEVEVTYVRQPDGKKKVFVLQSRRMEFSTARAARFDEICKMESRIIARGAGAHGGALSGVVSFARFPEQAVRLEKETGMPVILLRSTADTRDVSLMPAIRGIVTSAGGVTSHAAVLAQKFDVNAVVGCSGMAILRNSQGEPYATFDGITLAEGSVISIDGSSGLVFSGLCPSAVKSEGYFRSAF